MEGKLSERRLGLQAWAIWLAAVIYVIYQFGLQVSVAVFSPELAQDLKLSNSGLGVMAALFPLAYGLTQVPAGVLLDRFSPRFLMTGSAFVCALAAFVFGHAHSELIAGSARFMMGVGAAFAFIGASFLAGRWFAPERFAFFIGLTEMGGMIGAASSDLMAGSLEHLMSWREMFFFVGVFGLTLALGILLIVRDAPPDFQHPQSGSEITLEQQVGALLTNKQIWLAGAFYFLSLGSLLGFAGLWNVPFQLSFDLTVSEAALATALIFIGWGFGSVLGGWLSDRIGRRPILFTCVAGHMVFMAIILFTPILPFPVIWFLRLGLGFFGGMNIVAFALACDHAPAAFRGTTLGLINTLGFAGVTVLQILPGLLLSGSIEPISTREYEWVLSAYLVALLLAATLLVFTREGQRASQTPSTN